ncbi:MAG TPA: trypsin-like peptidase domain-containing protein [Candidatus Saccharimonadia bacterium]|nr:trypsin-like peptidase domain-containing protein [Candidatus Saccharimonadia bacterium]
MLGFNWVDLIILLLLASAVYGGLKIGLFTLLFVFGGFFGTIFLGGWLFPHIFPFHDHTLLTIVNANLVLITSSFAALKGYDVGQRLHYSLKGRWHRYESLLGLTLSISSCLLLVWLLGAAFGRLPFVGISNSANSSFFVQKLDRIMPPMPAFMAEFDKQIDPNTPPFVFAQPKPRADFDFSQADYDKAVGKGTPSVVRITGFGCGGVVSGSGFVVGQGLVATSAHIVAGVKRPIVKYNDHSYEGVPVVFDAGLDLAVLRVAGLDAPVLQLAGSD